MQGLASLLGHHPDMRYLGPAQQGQALLCKPTRGMVFLHPYCCDAILAESKKAGFSLWRSFSFLGQEGPGAMVEVFDPCGSRASALTWLQAPPALTLH